MDLEMVTHVVTIALSIGVGLPILMKAIGAGDRLGALLAASLLVDGIEWLFWAGHLYWPTDDAAIAAAFAIACRVGISASVLCIGCFTWRTFRADNRAAACFFWISFAAMVVGFVGSGSAGDWPGFRSDHVWIWVENVAQIAVYSWGCTEALLYHSKACRRVALGLADPVVANRFALWGTYAGCYGVVQLSFLIALASPDGYTEISSADSVFTFVGVGALWLGFSPPQRYQAWLRKSTSPGS